MITENRIPTGLVRCPDLLVMPELLRPDYSSDLPLFDTTADLLPLDWPMGQDRGVKALEFGLKQQSSDYHIFVSGAPGTGRSYAIRRCLEQIAPAGPDSCDWCYVYAFESPDHPEALSVPAGKGSALASDMDALIESCRTEIAAAFENESCRQKYQELRDRFAHDRRILLEAVQAQAKECGTVIEFSPTGFAIVPLIADKPMTADDYRQLTQDAQSMIDQNVASIEARVEETMLKIRNIGRMEEHERDTLNRDVAAFAVGHLVDDLRVKYEQVPVVLDRLHAVREDLLKHFQLFLPQEPQPTASAGIMEDSRKAFYNRYRVNVLVDNRCTSGAPVVWEHNPTYYNLTGRVDYRAEFGAMVTDFTMVKSGDLQRANGGYLVLDALQVLENPLAWSALMRALQSKLARIENLAEQYGLAPSATIKPQPVPLRVKVVLIGEPELYRLLYQNDKDFRALFRYRADFDSEADRSPALGEAFARFIATLCIENNLDPFQRAAVLKILEQTARVTEDQGKISLRLMDIAGLVMESAACVSDPNTTSISAAAVEQAIAQMENRSNLIEEKVQDQILDGTIFIDVDGEQVGQVNGLSVYEVGDYAFAKPTRVTARTSMGADGVVDIDREVKLSGPVHSKGVLILTSYLSHCFAQDKPLALSASLAFEQTYGEVEGDSASAAELFAILSSLSGAALRQDIAVTGSVNQRGDIQPIGGASIKIEGFFGLCKARGLTGSQGVIIPHSNLKNLGLSNEVVEAVRHGQFHIWSISSVEQGIEILTGIKAGTRDEDYLYPPGTIFGRADARLRKFAEYVARGTR